MIRALALAVFSALLLGLCALVPSSAQATTTAPTSTHVVSKKHPKKKGHKNKRPRKAKKVKTVVWPIGPGQQGPTVKDIQSRLKLRDLYPAKITGFYNPATQQAVLAFQTNQGLPATGLTDRATYQKLTELTDAMAPGADPRCRTGRALCIDKRSRSLRWMIDGRVIKTVDVRFGASYSPTREGSFRVFKKSRNHVSSIFHTAMPFSMFFSGGQAVHYSSDFARKGYNGASHGCVNVRDYGALRSIFDQVRIGDKVIVYWSK
ncbi:MAG: L,D-transpeptidase family protein [Nocardioidaceae bacterium]